MKTFKTLLTALLTLAMIPAATWAQDYSLDTEKSSIIIDGTSNVHDWEAEVTEMDLDIEFDAEAAESGNMADAITSLVLTVESEGIDSDKRRMNNNIYDALKTDDHPEITFTMSDIEMAEEGNSMTVTGDLFIAGVEREVSFDVEAQETDGGYQFDGTYTLNMVDYEVDPPTAMFGSIKTGEEVEIIFSIAVRE